jgi:sulfur transfer protein SufE
MGALAISLTAHIAARLLTAVICQLRTELTDAQRLLLRSHLDTAINAFFIGQTNISRQLRGLLAILFHELSDEEQDALWQQLVMILNAFDLSGVIDEEPAIVTYDVDHDADEKSSGSLPILIDQLRIRRDRAIAIPISVRSALVSELCNGTAPPQCSITLEDILDSDGHIVPGVVALVQKLTDAQQCSRFHVYLYKSEALEHWFSVGGAVNPLTRERIHRSSQLFALS